MADQLDGSQIGTLTEAISASATSMVSEELRDLRRIPHTSNDVIRIVIDPDGNPEIVVITTHTSGSREAIITRGQEGTTARSHSKNTVWQVSITAGSLTGSNMSGTRLTKEGSVNANRITARTLTPDRFEVAPLNFEKGLQYSTAGRIEPQPIFNLGGLNSARLLMTLSVGGDRGSSGDQNGNEFDGIIPFELLDRRINDVTARVNSPNISQYRRSTYCTASTDDGVMPADLSNYHSILIRATSRVRAPNLPNIVEIDHHVLVPVDKWGHAQSSDNSLPSTTIGGKRSPFDAQLTSPPKKGHVIRCWSQIHKNLNYWTNLGSGTFNSVQVFMRDINHATGYGGPGLRWENELSTWDDNHREFICYQPPIRDTIGNRELPNPYAITDYNSIRRLKDRTGQNGWLDDNNAIRSGYNTQSVIAGRGTEFGGTGDWWGVGSTSAVFTGVWKSGGRYIGNDRSNYVLGYSTNSVSESQVDFITLSADETLDTPLIDLSPTFAILYATSRTTWRLAFPDTCIQLNPISRRLVRWWSTLRLWELVVRVYGVGNP